MLAGQTNSLFMDGDIFPNTIDYWGPTGMVFYRNVQIRWTPFKTDNSHFAIAIERPGNDVDAGNVRLIEGFEDVQIQNDEELPDLTAQYRIDGDWGHFQVGRHPAQGRFRVPRRPRRRVQRAAAKRAGASISPPRSTLSVTTSCCCQVVYGEGIASYMNDGGMDLAPTAARRATVTDLQAEAVPLTGVIAYYDHYWSEKWSSSIGYSYTEVDNTNFQDRRRVPQG